MTYLQWNEKLRNNRKYINEDTIVFEINKASEEIYNHNSGKQYQEDAGVYNGNDYRCAISRKIGNYPDIFLHCSDGIFLATSRTETGHLLRKGTCNLNIKFL